MTGRGGRLVRALPVGAAAVLLTGCLSLPQDGPVVGTGAADADAEPGPMYIDPSGPTPGDSPTQVVKGFLDAMLATPVQTSVAREFLASESRSTWDPQRTVIFGAAAPPREVLQGDAPAGPEGTAGTSGTSQVVSVDLTETHLIDERGAWQGARGDRTLRFGLVVEDGEHRIDAPPDALVVPARWFEPRFRQVSLYFFDPTGTILVPEPAFVPSGEQLASTLVRGLLEGPPGSGAGLTRSFLPPGLSAGLSVPVSEDGLADIALTGGTGTPTREQAELLLAQLTSTLRQDPAITSVRVTIDGEPLGVPGDVLAPVGRDRGAAFATYDAGASSPLYGLRDGLLISGSPGRLGPVPGPFGTSVLGVRSIAPDLSARSAAAVSADGTSVLVGPVRRIGSVTQVLSGAVDLLRPTWDFSGRLWLVDRTEQGARVLSRRGDETRELDVPGVTGQDVRGFLVSRDGSRLVALVRSPGPGGGDTVWVSRVRHDTQGRVLRSTPAVRIDDEGDSPGRIRDLAWRTPTSLALLTRVGGDLFRVRGMNVDGAPGGLTALSITVEADVHGLVGSPDPSQSLFAVGAGTLVPLVVRTDGPLPLDPGITDLFYSG